MFFEKGLGFFKKSLTFFQQGQTFFQNHFLALKFGVERVGDFSCFLPLEKHFLSSEKHFLSTEKHPLPENKTFFHLWKPFLPLIIAFSSPVKLQQKCEQWDGENGE